MEKKLYELGMVGLVLPANGGDLGLRKPLGHPDYWPLYEEAERLKRPPCSPYCLFA